MPRLFTSRHGAADFDALHSGTVDDKAVALAFDLLLAGDDLRRRPLIERKNTLKWVLRKSRGGIQYVDHTEGDGEKMFKAVCKLGLEGIVSKKLTSVYRSGPSKAWLKIKNPKSPAATRAGWDVLAREIARCGIGRRHIRAYSLASLNRGLFCAGFCTIRGRSRPPRRRRPDSSPRPQVPRVGATIPAMNCDFIISARGCMHPLAMYLLQPFQ